MITNFVYNDIVLYCKGWYQTPEGDTMLDDLGYLLSKIYAWTPKTESEIAHFMIIILDKLYSEMKLEHNNDFSKLFEEINRNTRLYKCSFNMAIILYVHSVLQGLSVDKIKLNAPHYGKKEHFRLGMLLGKYPISQTYTEMNHIAQKAFC
jgi:hypothetical protein